MTIANTTVITCDKCGTKESARSNAYNEEFSTGGWALRAGKHYCKKCNKRLKIK